MKIRNKSHIVAILLGLAVSSQATAGAKLNDVFNASMLGKQLRYFESVAGITQEIRGTEHYFKVAGCEVVAEVAQNAVVGLSLTVSPKCPANLTSFLGESFAPDPRKPLTFGRFAEAAGPSMEFHADCLSGCGNAYDPGVQAYWEGPHALNFIQVRLEVLLVNEPALTASSQWRDGMVRQKGEDYVMDTRFNCERSFDDMALAAFKDVPVTRVTIGQGLLDTAQCN